MLSVGIRNLKNQLSKYLALVRAGNVVLVTDRDEVVAQILPASPAWVHEPGSKEKALLARLAALGQVRLARRRTGPRPPLYPSAQRIDLAVLLEETRRDRVAE